MKVLKIFVWLPFVIYVVRSTFAIQTCQKEGIFQDMEDLSCKKYYLCMKQKFGSYMQMFYTCPDGSYFNPVDGMCSTSYYCPYNIDCTSKNTTFTCENIGKYDDPNDPYCNNYYLCTQMPDKSFIATLYACPEGQKFDTLEGSCSEHYQCPCNPDSFVCLDDGRFADPNDPNCSQYYVCSKLSDGTFVKNKFSCQADTKFDPVSEECSFIYECEVNNLSEECTGTGKYKKLNDVSCTKYYSCSLGPNENFIKTELSCPEGSFFDETLSDCSISYQCPLGDEDSIKSYLSTTTEKLESEQIDYPKSSVCDKNGRVVNPDDTTCKSYYMCSLLNNGSYVQKEYSCLLGSYFDPDLKICSTVYECPGATTSSPNMKITQDISLNKCGKNTDNFECFQEGRFIDDQDPSCSTYFLCSLLQNGSFIQTQYNCPSNSWFDPELQQCSVYYQCPCSISSTTVVPTTNQDLTTMNISARSTTSEATTIAITTTAVCYADENYQEFVCADKGRFYNPKDLTCTTYYLCTLLRNGSLLQTEYMCPAGSYFDPDLQLCSIYYKCPCTPITPELTTISSTTTSTTPEATTIATTTAAVCYADENYQEFVCAEKGRFYNPKDLTCTTYYLCTLLRNGSLLQTEYTCPAGSYFDPDLQLCSIYYKCPCTPTTTPASPEVTTISSTTTSTTPEATTIATTTTAVCYADENYQEFVCAEKGRFYNPKDLTCTTYYLCTLLRNGSLLQTEYTCPAGSYFDPDLQLCSIYHKCPCTPTTTPASPEVTTISSTTTSTAPEVTTVSSTTTSATPEATTAATTTTAVCYADENYQEFVCAEKGRFYNPKNQTCTTYYLCTLLRNGSLLQTEYMCPVGSYFDPDLQLCSIYYKCPCTPITPELTTISSTTTSTTPEATTIATTTAAVCYANENYQEFVCAEKGRFYNPKDLTCTTYYLCTLLRNGSLLQTEYTCPAGSYFDPDLQLCSIYYKCPCTPTTTPASPEVTTISSTTTSTTPEATTIATTTTTTAVCYADENYQKFVCAEKGRFYNPKDLTCTTYYLCTLLRNGSLLQTEYTCPAGSYFDPDLQLCSIYHKCPCTPITPELTTISSTTTSTTPEATTIATTTTAVCYADENYLEFVCVEKGRFYNPKDLTCTSYYLCTLLRNGSLLQTEYTCPAGSYFDPDLQLCSIYYKCPCTPSTTPTSPEVTTISSTTTSTTTEATTIATTTTEVCYADENYLEFVCAGKGRFYNPKDLSCTTYYLCTLLRNGSLLQTEYICPAGSYFDPDLQLCSIYYKCPCTPSTTPTSSEVTTISSTTTSTTTEATTIATTTTAVCYADENYLEFVCAGKGRFYNPKDLTCTSYYLCTLLRNGSLLQTEYTCPAGSYFDPDLQLCSIYYKCPCTPSTTPTSPEVTTIATTTTAVCYADENYLEFVCAGKGRFYNPKDLTCTSYYLCTLLRNGSLLQTEYTCPAGSYFDPDLQLCSIYYKCPCTPTTTPTSPEVTTISSTTTSTTPEATTIATTTAAVCYADENYLEFVCAEKGRFYNPKDLSCTTYYLCTLLRNGSLLQTEYICPAGSYFDPDLQLCSIYYKCPCTPINPEVTTISSTTTSTTPETTTITTTTTAVCYADENYQEFVCADKGRFYNPKDLGCTTYYLCTLLRNGSLLQTEYACPAGSYFDPDLQLCSIYYKCPCTPISPEVTTISSTTTSATPEATTITTTTTTVCYADENYLEFVCAEKGRFYNPKDLSCTTYYLCTLLRNGSLLQTEYTCPAGSYFDPDLQLCSIYYKCPGTPTTTPTSPEVTTISSTTTSGTPEATTITTTTTAVCYADENYLEFVCADKGRFYNPKDLNCTTYYLCTLLRNGSLLQTEYMCPAGSYFDPDLQLCSIYYKCPCTLISSEVTTISSTTTSTTPEATTIATTTAAVCYADENYLEFVCAEKGRFYNPKDLSCTTYYLCTLLRNGSLLQTEYTCPAGSYFDPDLQLCSIYYKCPCTSISPEVTTISSTTTSTTPETTTIAITTTAVCYADENYQEFVCAEKGRFYNPKDLSCTTYYLCTLLRNGSLLQTEYTCPAGSYFDPDLQLCSIYYTCPCTPISPEVTTMSSTTTSTTPEATTIATTTEICYADENNLEFKCTGKGRFYNPKDVDCETYYLCSLLRDGSFIQTEYSCPAGSYFDPDLQLCSIFYKCPCSKTSTTQI